VRRGRQREKRRKRESACLFKKIKVFNGACVLIRVLKKDGRRNSKNCDMIVRCYLPITQASHCLSSSGAISNHTGESWISHTT
jgi:hypothetical protein